MALAHRTEKVALVTGITGQDGVLLTELLLEKGYIVHGLARAASPRVERLKRHLAGQADLDGHLILHDGDLTDRDSLVGVIEAVDPAEFYNLGGQTHVQASFERGIETFQANGCSVTDMIGAIQSLNKVDRLRFFQASSSELYGVGADAPLNEQSPFRPQNPYAIAKFFAHEMVVCARRDYGMHASNGILFNHESPLRDDSFVTRKISLAAASIRLGLQDRLQLGNLDARRDWGHASDYVRGMWLMLQQDQPGDYVLASGQTATVRDFVMAAFAEAGMAIDWRGEGVEERGLCAATGRTLVEVSPRYFREGPARVLVGDAAKARAQLGWSPNISWRELCAEMVKSDLDGLALVEGENSL
jgi:GDPmannose 4,6-dehydratase